MRLPATRPINRPKASVIDRPDQQGQELVVHRHPEKVDGMPRQSEEGLIKCIIALGAMLS